MRLVVKHGVSTIQELEFHKGPVYVGRHVQNHVVLSDAGVSRQHAVLYFTPGGQAMVEDLHSGNGTFLNGRPIEKAPIKPGDVVRVADYILEVRPDTTVTGKANMEDTVVGVSRRVQVIGRRFSAEHGPDISMPANRIADLADAARTICRSRGPDQMAHDVATLILRQFGAGLSWCGLRQDTTGPWTSQAAVSADARTTTIDDPAILRVIDLAVEKLDFVLCPQGLQGSMGRSLLVCPAVESGSVVGCLLAQAKPGRPFYLRDLDYLTILALVTGAVAANL